MAYAVDYGLFCAWLPDLSNYYLLFLPPLHNVDRILKINYACYLFHSSGLRPAK